MRGHRWVRLLALGGLVAGPLTVVAITAQPAAAATPVSTPSDLFSAWQTATSIQVLNDITFQPADCVSLGQPTRSSTNGDVVLDGQGHTLTMNCVHDTMLRVDSGSNDSVMLQNVTITSGAPSGPNGSGGISLEGTGALTLNGVTMTGNNNDGGGAVSVGSNSGSGNPGGTLTIKNSTLTNNTSCSNGGAIEYSDNGNVVIVNSTIANNRTDSDGGAIAHDGSTGNVSVTNSTITGNTASRVGGLEVDNGNLTLAYVTDVNNTTEASLGACLLAETADPEPSHDGPGGSHDKQPGPRARAAGDTPANLRVDQQNSMKLIAFGSVIAQPNGGPNCGDFSGPPPATLANTQSSGWNFANDLSCGLTATGDSQAGTNDPKLAAALANNGGPTATLLPQSGSPLIDAIPNAACQTAPATGITTDQRNLARPSPTGGACDIGAVEIQVSLPPTPTPAPAAVVITPRFTG